MEISEIWDYNIISWTIFKNFINLFGLSSFEEDILMLATFGSCNVFFIHPYCGGICNYSAHSVVWWYLQLLLIYFSSPTGISEADNFYHTDSEIAFWGEWRILESVTSLSSAKPQIRVQEDAGAPARLWSYN